MVFWWVKTSYQSWISMGWFSKAARDSFDSSCHCGFTRNSIVRSSMETNGNWAELVALGDCHLNGIPGSDLVVPSYPPLFSHQNSVGLNVRPPSKWVWLMDSVPKSHLEITAKTKRVYLWPRLSSLDIIGGPFWLPSVLEWPENALPPAENHESNETIKKVLQLKNIWGSVENYHDLKIIMTWRSLCFHIKTLGIKRPHGDFNAKYVSTSPAANKDFHCVPQLGGI